MTRQWRPVGPRALWSVATLALLGAAALVFAVPGGAEAANTRVGISDFAWSKQPSIDLGESVTWDWLGPDTAHSVTGTGPGGQSIDSDPSKTVPNHVPGDSFTVSFPESGQFTFACKIHAAVRGTVTVSDRPGDPGSDPGPQPSVFFDAAFPDLRDPHLTRNVIGPHGKGTGLTFSVDERGAADADYFRVVEKGRRSVRKFAGSSEWRTHIGFNTVRFGARTRSFRARPGRYVALFRVSDPSGNSTRPVVLAFEVRAPAPLP
ncbi:MAG: cupredoxin domain-containing protein [Solirubrobacterales bacterium]